VSAWGGRGAAAVPQVARRRIDTTGAVRMRIINTSLVFIALIEAVHCLFSGELTYAQDLMKKENLLDELSHARRIIDGALTSIDNLQERLIAMYLAGTLDCEDHHVEILVADQTRHLVIDGLYSEHGRLVTAPATLRIQ
jgi:hypothetical protein